MDRRKQVDELVVGDFVRASYKVHRVVRVTKTQISLVPWQAKEGDVLGRFKISRRSGKIIGSNQYLQVLEPDETPESIAAKGVVVQDKRKKDREEKERKFQAQLEAVKEANPDMKPEHVALDVQLVKFKNKAGVTGLLFFTTTPDSVYDYDLREEVPAFRIKAISYTVRWHNTRERSFSSPNDVVTTRTIDGLIQLIATTYWD